MSENSQYSPIAFLGLVADYKRKLKDGSRYDKLIPKAQGTYDIVTNNGNVQRTVSDMDKYCRETLEDTIKLAPLLQGKTLPESLKNVFDFWFNHCQYKLDKDGVEELRRPRRAWHDGQILARNPQTEPQSGIDCDCFSISVGSCLMNLGINFKFRITKYNAGWQHVYVVVPLPNDSKRYYVIDCVLNRFNEEKTYTDKFDHTMNSPKTFLGGIPLARLGAIGDALINVAHEKNNLLNGVHFQDVEIDGLGASEEQSPMLDAILAHIKATRDIIAKEPQSMEIMGGAGEYLKMLDYAIKKWNTSEREDALDKLEQEEERWNLSVEKNGAVSGTDGGDDIEEGFTGSDDDAELAVELEGLGKLKIKKGGKTFFSNVKKSVAAVKKVNKKIAEKVKKGVKDAGASIKATTKKAGKLIKKFLVLSNPLTLAMRAGFLLAMKTNLFQWAERAYPAYFTQAEAEKMGVTKAAWELSKKAKDALENVFVKIGGKPSKLEKYIKSGRAKKKLSGLVGELGEPASTAAVIVSSAATLITAMAKMKQAGVDDKTYKSANQQPKQKSGVKGFGETDEPEVEAPEVIEGDSADTKGAAFKKFVIAIKNFFSKKKNKAAGEEDGSGVAKELEEGTTPGDAAESVEANAKLARKTAYDAAIAAGKTTAEALAAGDQAYEDAGGGDTGNGGGIIDFIKANPVKVGLGVLLIGTAITLAVSPKARTMVGIGTKTKTKLNGLGKVAVYRKGLKVKKSKAMLPSGSKVKRIVLK